MVFKYGYKSIFTSHTQTKDMKESLVQKERQGRVCVIEIERSGHLCVTIQWILFVSGDC